MYNAYSNGFQRIERDDRSLYSWLYMDRYGGFDRISKGQAIYLIVALGMVPADGCITV